MTRNLAIVLALLLSSLAGCLGGPAKLGPDELLERPALVTVWQGGLEVGGRPYFVKGVDYAPWGREAPAGWDGWEPFDDFARLKGMGANNVRLAATHEPAFRTMLDRAAAFDLSVVVSVRVADDASAFDAEDARTAERELRTLVAEHRDHPAVLLWEIGDAWDAEASGDTAAYRSFLQRAATIVHLEDPRHPVVTTVTSIDAAAAVRADAPAVDVIGLRAYPQTHDQWVLDVFEPYAERVGDRPLLVAGFGSPAVDPATGADRAAEQADVLERAARDIHAHRQGGTRLVAGGIVDAFADEADRAGRPAGWRTGVFAIENGTILARAAVGSLRGAWAGMGPGSPPSIVAVERILEDGGATIRARIVAYANASVDATLLYRGGGTMAEAPMHRAEDGWFEARLAPLDGVVFVRVRAVDAEGRDRTSEEAVIRAVPHAFLAGAGALLVAAGVARRA